MSQAETLSDVAEVEELNQTSHIMLTELAFLLLGLIQMHCKDNRDKSRPYLTNEQCSRLECI